MFDPTEERQHAAMYAAIGNQCQLSARGYEVIFTEGLRLHDRADLSGHGDTAARQLAYAGIEPANVTEEQMEAYRLWRKQSDERHALDTAHFVITAPRGDLTDYMHTHVQLKVSGEVIAWAAVRCGEEYKADVKNNIGRMGAYVLKPNAEGIQQQLNLLRTHYPKFASAPVTNNTEVNLDEEEI